MEGMDLWLHLRLLLKSPSAYAPLSGRFDMKQVRGNLASDMMYLNMNLNNRFRFNARCVKTVPQRIPSHQKCIDVAMNRKACSKVARIPCSMISALLYFDVGFCY